MKLLRPAFFALLVAASVPALPAQNASAPAPKPLEPARIAYVNSAAFLDEVSGIKQLVRVTQNLQSEFSTTEGELSLLNEKLRTVATEIDKLNIDPKTNAKAIEDKQAEGLRLQQELQGKQQAAQAAFQKRQQEVQAPVAAEIGKALRAYAKVRDVGLLFDLAKLGDGVVDAKPDLDLTADFIASYNASHQ